MRLYVQGYLLALICLFAFLVITPRAFAEVGIKTDPVDVTRVQGESTDPIAVRAVNGIDFGTKLVIHLTGLSTFVPSIGTLKYNLVIFTPSGNLQAKNVTSQISIFIKDQPDPATYEASTINCSWSTITNPGSWDPNTIVSEAGKNACKISSDKKTFSFDVQLDTAKIGAVKDSATGQRFALVIQDATTNNKTSFIAGALFDIKPTVQACTKFKIDGVQDTDGKKLTGVTKNMQVELLLKPVIPGSYEYSLYGIGEKKTQSCGNEPCKLAYAIPSNATSNVKFIVKGPAGDNQDSCELNVPVTDVAPIDTTIKTEQFCPVCPDKFQGYGYIDDKAHSYVCCKSIDHCEGEDKKAPKSVDNCGTTDACIARVGCQSKVVPSAYPPCITDLENTKGGCNKFDSAIGPISTLPAAFVSYIFRFLLGIAGGLAVLVIIAAGYSMMFSGGDAKVIQEARERITAAIVGLVFLIFSFVILQIIGVDILHIPFLK